MQQKGILVPVRCGLHLHLQSIASHDLTSADKISDTADLDRTLPH